MKQILRMSVIWVVLLASRMASAQVVNWKLDFQSADPQPIMVRFGENFRNYHYVIYTITNASEVDVDVSLEFGIATDSNKDYFATDDPVAERAIIIREAKLEDAVSITESIQQLKADKKYLNALEIAEAPIAPGETRQGIAIFAEVDPNMDRMILQVGGLTNSVRVIKGEITTKVEVLRLYYERRGDEFNVDDDVLAHHQHMDHFVQVAEFGQMRADVTGAAEEWVKTKRK